MAVNQNPNQERGRNRHTHNPPQKDPNQPHHVRPMDDPGRGHGDKLERHLPGHEQPDPDEEN